MFGTHRTRDGTSCLYHLAPFLWTTGERHLLPPAFMGFIIILYCTVIIYGGVLFVFKSSISTQVKKPIPTLFKIVCLLLSCSKVHHQQKNRGPNSQKFVKREFLVYIYMALPIDFEGVILNTLTHIFIYKYVYYTTYVILIIRTYIQLGYVYFS